MAFELTPMQQKAVDTKGNILVAAAAGSGKTSVLVERVIKSLTDSENPISADRLLIVTFTNAAAAEMRSRIEKRLFEECEKHPENTGLLKQKLLLPSADICTIDSFCINLVRENFEKCHVEPDFKISDDSLLKPIRDRVMAEIMDRLISDNSNEFEKLLEITNCEYDETNLCALVADIYTYIKNLPFPERFLDNLSLPYETDFAEGHTWYDGAFSYAKELLEECQFLVEQMANTALYVEKNQEKFQKYAQNLSMILNNTFEVLSYHNWDLFKECIFASNIPNAPATEKQDRFGALFKEDKATVSENLKKIQSLFILSREENLQLNNSLLPSINLLKDTVLEYSNRVFEECKKEGSFTFSDIEQLALSLLLSEEDADSSHLEDKYDEVLVDEFQDVNDLQNMLFYVLSNKEKKLFVVGDVKQSIYGFRGANPHNFLSKKNSYIPINESSNETPKKIILSDNFRSRKGICDYINYFFSLIMNGQVGGIVYNSEEYLNAKGEFLENSTSKVDLLIADKTEDEDFENRLHYEGRCIGEYIKGVMEEGEIIHNGKDSLRNAKYSDFVILLDAMKNKAPIIAEELSNMGIPVSLSSENFMESVEISNFLSLLKVIDNPKSDVELLNVLMSPIFAFSAEEIAKMRIDMRKDALFSAVVSAAKTGNTHAENFLNSLAEMRSLAAVMSLDRLITKLLNDTDYLNIVSAMEGGAVRRANLFTLQKIAATYSSREMGSIYGFLEYISSLPEKAVKSATVTENCVRIMSMHNSKGLQFPVCIVGNLSGKINTSDSYGNVLYNENSGLAIKYTNINEEVVSTVGHTLISKYQYIKNIEERMRLLYVALTRAEDRLCLVSSSDKTQNALNNIVKNISQTSPRIRPYWLKNTKTMNEWVMACALLHPDTEKLRDIYDISLPSEKTDSHINVVLMNQGFETVGSTQNISDNLEINRDLAEKIEENISFVYPFESLRDIQAKSSVSAVANKAEKDRFSFTEKPSFMLDKGLSAADRGTAMHHIMQFINIDGLPNIENELERLTEWQFITPAEAQVADKKALTGFFESDLFKRVLNSPDVRREMRFLSEIPAKNLDSSLTGEAANTNVVVQGAVDLCFVEDEKVVIVDFKTDRVETEEQLKEAYSEQLNIYSKACEKVFSKEVKEKIIYSFHLSKEIKL